MAVITGTDYRDLAVAYSNARDTTLGAKQYLFDSVYLVVLLQSIQPEVDLLEPFWDSYTLNSASLQAPTLLMGAVRALNSHVLSAGGYETVDAYLVAEGITVPQTWADLSAQAGYTITEIDP